MMDGTAFARQRALQWLSEQEQACRGSDFPNAADGYKAVFLYLERMETLAPLLDRLAAEWTDPQPLDLPTEAEYAAVVAVVKAWKLIP